MMLQQDKPEDFVVATGESHSVREFVEASFAYVGRDIEWVGHGLDEVGREKVSGIVRVTVNAKYFRPTEVVSVFINCLLLFKLSLFRIYISFQYLLVPQNTHI